MNLNPRTMKKILISGHNPLKKGQNILYEGKEAKVISVEPMFTIKVDDRVICGALRSRIELIDK